jgi:hypothetical protein
MRNASVRSDLANHTLGNQPRIVRRVTIDGPVWVGIDGRCGKRRNSDAQVSAAALKEHSGAEITQVYLCCGA